MRTRAIRTAIATGALAACLAAPGGASAAAIAVDRACYPSTPEQAVTITGQGFDPGANYLVLVGGGVVGTGVTDASGNVKKTLGVPEPPESGKDANDAGYAVAVQQGAITVQTSFRAARVFGDFNPGSGDPRRLRVRFSAFGFGVATAAGQPMPEVFVHYVDPRGKVKRTISLGRGTAPCGTIKRTALRKLFPFSPRPGRWTLQFDTQRKYVKGTSRSRFLFDSPSLTISRG